jgi:hypothetical protein
MRRKHIGPVTCEQLDKVLAVDLHTGWQRLPNGQMILVGTEHIYAREPVKCSVDLGGPIPYRVEL